MEWGTGPHRRARPGNGPSGSAAAVSGGGYAGPAPLPAGPEKFCLWVDRADGGPVVPCASGPSPAAGEVTIKARQNDIANTLETILLVDDEAYIRELVGAILAVEGYHVLEAADGEAALKVESGYADPIHLLLTDVVMSPMGGGELVKRILPLRPDIKVLYISGYPDDPAVRLGLDSRRVSFLAKPFSPKMLVRTIRSILDGIAAPA